MVALDSGAYFARNSRAVTLATARAVEGHTRTEAQLPSGAKFELDGLHWFTAN